MHNISVVFLLLGSCYTLQRTMKAPVVVKKYSNRRLYDTQDSRYITLEDLAAKIRAGTDVRVQDAKTGEDLTQATLTQIIIESRDAGRLLPVPLLMQLIRMGDDALAEFLGRYMTWALDLYLSAKQGAQQIQPVAPFATVPFSAANAVARMLSGVLPWNEPPPAAHHRAPTPPPAAEPEESELAQLRRELEELKAAVGGKKKRR